DMGNGNASLTNNVPILQAYGLNTQYRPHRFVLNYSYNLPFGNHTGFVDKVASGWSVSGVTTIQDGVALNLTDARGGSVFGSPGGATIAPAQCHNANCAGTATSGSIL